MPEEKIFLQSIGYTRRFYKSVRKNKLYELFEYS